MTARETNGKRLVAALLIALLAACFCVAPGERTARADNVLRLHILANSDSTADQRTKLAVRDAILAFLPPSASEREAETYLMENGRALLTLVERTLQENGADYGATLMLGRYPFPDRTYGDKAYPAGEYQALRILLGSGAGQNWWCVLFPPLCIVTAEEEPLPEPDEIEFESSILTWIRSMKEEEAA